MAFEQVPQNVEDDGCLAGARATCDDEILCLSANNGFGLAFFDGKFFVAEWLADACYFIDALFDFVFARLLPVFE